MQQKGLFLAQPRYHLFAVEWIALLFVMSILLAHLYAWSRATAGPGPRTALKIGMIVGFCAGVPGNFGQAAWSTVPRLLPLGWMLDLWGGCIVATVVATRRTAPRQVTRAGTRAIEAIFRFETAEGRGSGVLRLIPDADDTCALRDATSAVTDPREPKNKIGCAG